MRDRYRPVGLDLAAKPAHDRARAVQHVAEPHHREDGPPPAVGGARLQDHLGQPLAGAHDARRPDRLVRRHQHEPLHAAPFGRLGKDLGAEGVVAQARDRIVLDDRHVLVGRRMVDRLDAVGLDRLADERGVED